MEAHFAKYGFRKALSLAEQIYWQREIDGGIFSIAQLESTGISLKLLEELEKILRINHETAKAFSDRITQKIDFNAIGYEARMKVLLKLKGFNYSTANRIASIGGIASLDTFLKLRTVGKKKLKVLKSVFLDPLKDSD